MRLISTQLVILLYGISRHWQPVFLFVLVATSVLSLLPLAALPEAPGSDKTHHLIAYGAMIFPVALRKPKSLLFIVLAVLFWSGVIELIQPYVNRYAEWLDWLANMSGIFIGLLVGLLARHSLKRVEV